jgi:hypothetical protein
MFGGIMQDHLYLAHHGIKGQRWGVRRFQNPDGSLTEAGKRRQYKQDSKRFKKEFKRAQKNKSVDSDMTRQSKVRHKIYDESINSDEYKAFTKYANDLAEIAKSSAEARGIRPDQVVFDRRDPAVQRYMELQKAFSERGKKIAEKHLDELAKATIDDIQLTDSPAARDAIKELIIQGGYYRYFDYD